MNPVQLHLLVNHVSLFAVLFGLMALLWSLAKNSRDMRWASVGLFVLAGIFSWIALETGEGAEDVAEKIPGVVEAVIHDHEEAAELAHVAVMVLAATAFVSAILGRLRPAFAKPVQIIMVILALTAGGLLARAAHLGGLIRHDEIREAVPVVD